MTVLMDDCTRDRQTRSTIDESDIESSCIRSPVQKFRAFWCLEVCSMEVLSLLSELSSTLKRQD